MLRIRDIKLPVTGDAGIIRKCTIGKQSTDVHTANLNQAIVDQYLRRGMLHTWLIIPALRESKKDLKILGEDIRLAFDGGLETAEEPIRLN